jgi:hypothetical protein
MLLQTNSYVVPKDRRNEHARLVRRFRQTLAKLGCDSFEVYEQVSQNWGGQDSGGRFVQIMRFRDRRHQLDVQANERADPAAQALIQEFCELINFPFQQQQGLFAVGFYNGVLPAVSSRESQAPAEESAAPVASAPVANAPVASAPAAHPDAPEPQPVPLAQRQAQPAALQYPEDQAAKLRAVAEATHQEAQEALSAEQSLAHYHLPAPGEVASHQSDAAVRADTTEPFYFEGTPEEEEAAHTRPLQHAGPRLADDELDSGLTDLSDSNLLNLPELSSTDDPAMDVSVFANESQATLKLADGADSVESQEVEAMLERADARFTDRQDGDDLGKLESHLEGRNAVEPGRQKEGQGHKPPSAHPHMRLAQDDDSNGHDEPTDVQLFEPDEPVSPFGT